jgi:hypothetical protein
LSAGSSGKGKDVDDHESCRSSFVLPTVVVLVAMLVLYPAAVGPASRLVFINEGEQGRNLRHFIWVGWSDIAQERLVTCANLPVVGPSLCKAERPIRTTPDNIRIMVVLSVIFPKAHRADFVRATLA